VVSELALAQHEELPAKKPALVKTAFSGCEKVQPVSEDGKPASLDWAGSRGSMFEVVDVETHSSTARAKTKIVYWLFAKIHTLLRGNYELVLQHRPPDSPAFLCVAKSQSRRV
jgi:hypothetical protein